MSDCCDQIVAVDVMGGDGGPMSVIGGVELAAKFFPREIGKLLLVGDGEAISGIISSKKSVLKDWDVEIFPTSQCIAMDEKPMQALRHRKDSSMFRALDLLKEGKVAGVLSCGNTGCLVAGGTLKLRMMPGIDRPALGSVIPAPGGHFVLIDVGANPTTSAKSLCHNAVLGALHYQIAVNGSVNPRVGLLTIGTEEGKGGETIREAHELLKQISGEIDYYGLIEGFQLFDNVVDVVVCDGFVGNILLKTMESLVGTVKKYIRKEMWKNPLRVIGGLLANGVFRAMKRDLSADRFGGAPLLGLNGMVVKSHGSSSPEAVAHALRLTFRLLRMGRERFLSGAIGKINAIGS